MKTLNTQGINFIIAEEGIRLSPYLDSVGVPTIGIGCTWYPGGRRVSMKDKPISRDLAITMFQKVVASYEKTVNDFVRKDITQNQFNALVSICYNIGQGAFAKSTLLRLVNANPADPRITQAFLMWRNAGGKPILLNRRKREAFLYFTA